MPISSTVSSLDRKRLHSNKTQQNVNSDNDKSTNNKNFLTIEPALPGTTSKTLYRRSNSSLGTTAEKSHEALHPNECVTLHPNSDGTVSILRTSQEKDKNPDRISLDRRGLTVLPFLENEVNLRLLSLQHNLINNLESFNQQKFPFLVFLDVYDNQLEKIHCLDRLENLRVLLMGKNRVKRIEGLETLTKIEVLDLHGNQISHIIGLASLSQLKVLNLAGNQIRNVGPVDLRGLTALQEFNLRRNRIKKLLGFNETPSLQKLFLSNNEIQTVEDICSLAKATKIKEIAIDNNPISLGGDCVSFLVSYLSHLSLLNGLQITEQVRKAANAWRRNKESSNAAFMDLTSDVSLNVRREEVISNARTNWELLRSQTKCLAAKTSNAVSLTKNIKPDCDFILTSLGKPELKVGALHSKSRIVSSTKVPVLPDKKLNLIRTSSQDTENSQNTSSSNNSSGDLFRLPPILVPIINKMEQKQDFCGSKLSGSLSSIGPNVDSSASSLLSNTNSAESESDSSGSSTDRDEVQNVPTEHRERPLIEGKLKTLNEDEPSKASLRAGGSSRRLAATITLSNPPSSTSGSDISNPCSLRNRSIKSAAVSKSTVPRNRARPVTTKVKQRYSKVNAEFTGDKDREQGGDYLIEVCGRYLNVYGQGALRFIDKSWSISKAKDVTTVNFNYAAFNSITLILNKLKQRFSNTENFIFKDTNIQHLAQLNALAEVQGLSSLTIDGEGNPIAQKNWQSYAIYRLAHWGLRYINGKEVTENDINSANEEYKSLSDLMLWSLPNALLQPLLIRLQLDVGQKITEQNAKKWLLSADPALRNVVIKEALQCKRGSLTQDDLALRQKAKLHIGTMLDETCNAVYKLRLLDKQWPSILLDMVRNILLDYAQMDRYMKKKLQELK